MFLIDEECNNKIDLSSHKLSSYKLSLNNISLDKKDLSLIFISFILVISYFVVGIINYKLAKNEIEQKKEALKKYNLPLTLIQLNSIYSSLKEVDLKNQKIKKALEYFTKTPLQNKEEYESISYNNDFEIVISTNRNFDFYFKRYFKVLNSYVKDKKYYAKLRYE